MTDIVLLVENLPDEQAHAKAILASLGYKVAVTASLAGALRIWEGLGATLKGIITDLHFPERADDSDASRPAGLAIAAEAVRRGVPVVVCSSINHHYADYLKIVVEVLAAAHPLKSIPFVMDRKDWERAARELQNLIAKKES